MNRESLIRLLETPPITGRTKDYAGTVDFAKLADMIDQLYNPPGQPNDDWKTIRPLTPYIGLDGKPVVCSDCEELRGMIAEHKASMMPSKCYPVGGRACRFIAKGE